MNAWKKKGEELLKEIETARPAEGMVQAWFLGQVGWVMKYEDTLIAIDPVLNEIGDARMYEPPFAPDALTLDYVLCTHAHCDHMAPPTLQGILRKNPNVKIVVPAGCVGFAGKIGIPAENLLVAHEGSSIELTDQISIFSILTAHPVHVSSERDPDMSLGFEIDFGGRRVVHLGDTYLTKRLLDALKNRQTPDVLMMPVNGSDLFRAMDNCIGNMEAEEAAALAVTLKADISVPMHFDMMRGNTVDPLRFAARMRALAPGMEYRIPVPGARMIF